MLKVRHGTIFEKMSKNTLDGLKWRTIDSWHKSMIARVKTCSVKTNKDDKCLCLRNLHEDLAGFEPQFRGYTRKEMALFLKYYDIFVITYLSVSDQLEDLADENLINSTKRDIAMKAKIFLNYFKQAIPQAKFYACRHIKIAIERHNGFWWSFQNYWPNDFEKINIPKELDPSFYSDWINTADVNNGSLFHRGCGVLKKSVRFRSNIYNTKDSSTLKGGPFSKDACSNSEGLTWVTFYAKPLWLHYTKVCMKAITNNLWLNIEERMKYLID